MAAISSAVELRLVNRKLGIALACTAIAHCWAMAALAAPLEFDIGAARVRVTLDGERFRIGENRVVAWVRRSAEIVAGYYDGFPVAALSIRIRSEQGHGVRNGRALGGSWNASGLVIVVNVGSDVSEAELNGDWVLVHEMTHLALPEVGREHSWLSEGIATYVEGIARVQAGNLTEVELWQEDVRDMPKGLPAEGDEGLDRTHTWARTYWGGALFCLEADVLLRERTANRFGLQDALQAIARESGGMTTTWPIERVFRVGDAATGTTVLTDLYAETGSAPRAPDLDKLWDRLGISTKGGAISLQHDTTGAALRAAITRASRGPPRQR